MASNFPWDVFLSYSSRDKVRVRRLAEGLRAAGLRVWFDEWVIKPGDDIYASIEHGLEYTRTLILCLSPAASKSDWTKLERNTAIFRDPQNKERPVIPVLLEDCRRIPAALRRLAYIDWRGESSEGLATLIQSCQPPQKEGTAKRTSGMDVAPPGGALRPDDPFYLERETDAEVLAAAQRAAETIIIKAPRQMGKSSLLKRYLAKCQQAGKQTALLDLSLFTDDELADYATFLTLLAEALWQRLGQPSQATPPKLRGQRELIDYVGRSLLAAVAGYVVCAFDEADRLLGLPYQTDFFTMLRHWHERRTDTPPTAWARLGLALVISTEPYLLIKDSLRSPFNVRPPSELHPFNQAECRELNRRCRRPLDDAQVEQLWELLGGHPYLTHLAYYQLTRQHPAAFPTLLGEAADRYGPFGLHLRAVENKLEDAGQNLLKAMKQLARRGTAPSKDVFHRLYGAGLVRQEKGQVVPANQLYARFFRTL